MAASFGCMIESGVEDLALRQGPVPEVPNVKWDDVGGLEDVKISLHEMILYPIEHTEKYEKLGAQPIGGILLYGPAGCGKTLLAKATISECATASLSINCTQLLMMSPEESQARVRQVWFTARAAAPCVLFFDKLDAIAGEHHVMESLLSEMDRSFSDPVAKRVIFIGATDSPEVLDEALLHPGRIDELVYVPMPDLPARHAILQTALRNVPVAPNVPISFIAQTTDGFRGAELIHLCQVAARAAAWEVVAADEDSEMDVCREVGRKHFEKAYAVAGARRAKTGAEYGKYFMFRDKFDCPKALADPLKWPDKVAMGAEEGLESERDEIKRWLQGAISYHTTHPEVCSKLCLRRPTGVLLHGPPGCGHAAIAEALASKCSINFVSFKGSDLVMMSSGKSIAHVHEFFAKAQAAAPCVVFLDGLEYIVRRRGGGDAGGAEQHVTSQHLAKIDSLVAQNVFLIGATNRPELLDEALFGPGRLEQLIYIAPPDLPARQDILEATLNSLPVAPNVPIPFLAQASKGLVESDLVRLCNLAARSAVRSAIASEELDEERVDEISRIHFEDAFAMARRSVDNSTLAKFEEFNARFDPGIVADWPDDAGMAGGTAAANKKRRVEVSDFEMEVSDVKSDGIGGLEEPKRSLQEIMLSIRHAGKFYSIKGRRVPKFIFHGPCGYGQTLMAKTVATECKADFLSLRGTDLLMMWSNESKVTLRDVLAKARVAVPCVLFVDELDVIATAPRSGTGSSALDLLLAELENTAAMSRLADGSGNRGKCFFWFIGATSRPELFGDIVAAYPRLFEQDPLKKQIDKLIYIPLPDMPARQSILEAALKKSPVAPEVPISLLAQKTDGFSGADLTQLCQLAARATIGDAIATEKLKDASATIAIGRKHFEEAFSRARRSVDSSALTKFNVWKRAESNYRYLVIPNDDGLRLNMNWPEQPHITARRGDTAAADDDDDLHS